MLLAYSLLLSAVVQAPAAPCRLTASDRFANRSLNFRSFDQDGTLPSTARALAGRSCFAEAAQANVDYLLHSKSLTEYERNVVRFHTGQYLATSGQEREAALLIAGTQRGTDPKRPNFDWDSYVIGTYAFLSKDRSLLDDMAKRLSANEDLGNQMNSKVLKRFQRCFQQPYRVAYGTDRRCD